MREANFYERLEVGEHASTEEIRQSFRRLAKECHPDTNGGSAEKSAKFHSIREAYETLENHELRKRYNQSLRDSLAKEKKSRIQEKLFTLDTPTKLEIILAWSTTRPTFRTSFASSCLNRMAEGAELTPKQLDGIDNIIISFEIDVDVWLDDELRQAALIKFVENQEAARRAEEQFDVDTEIEQRSAFSAFTSD